MTALFAKGDLSQNIVLQPGNVVVVPTAKKMPWSTISQIISAASNIVWLHRTGW